jgi:hypothetical protein
VARARAVTRTIVLDPNPMCSLMLVTLSSSEMAGSGILYVSYLTVVRRLKHFHETFARNLRRLRRQLSLSMPSPPLEGKLKVKAL